VILVQRSSLLKESQMIPSLWVIVALGVLIAYVNGSNDVSKGIATLAGSGLTNYRRAILWGTVWTGLGGFAGALLAGAMVGTFGKGLLTSGIVPTFSAAVATILGAGAWVAFATSAGLPVSTTHAIVGSIVGVGAIAYGVSGVNWAVVGSRIALPLLLSPLAALLITTFVLRAWHHVAVQSGKTGECFCAEVEPNGVSIAAAPDGMGASFLTDAPSFRLTIDSQKACAVERPAAFRITMNDLHWLTSGTTSFARGMNDAPKMVAILLATISLQTSTATFRTIAFFAVTLGMIAGSWIAGRRVTTVLAEQVTPIDHRGGFVANLVTAALVGPGAALGLPMSTTHVSSGAIIAVGTQNAAGLQWKTIREMLLAWGLTLPAAALLGILFYALLQGPRVQVG
jgi:PiT family inorganic phosphate transporter